MQPKSRKAFFDVLSKYVEPMYSRSARYTNATLATLGMVSIDAEAIEDYEDESEEFVFNYLEDIYDWTENSDKLKDYIKNRYLEDCEDNENGSEFFSIGNSDDYWYENLAEFYDDVDFERVILVIKKCWAQACSSGIPFPEDESDKDFNGFSESYNHR